MIESILVILFACPPIVVHFSQLLTIYVNSKPLAGKYVGTCGEGKRGV